MKFFNTVVALWFGSSFSSAHSFSLTPFLDWFTSSVARTNLRGGRPDVVSVLTVYNFVDVPTLIYHDKRSGTDVQDNAFEIVDPSVRGENDNDDSNEGVLVMGDLFYDDLEQANSIAAMDDAARPIQGWLDYDNAVILPWYYFYYYHRYTDYTDEAHGQDTVITSPQSEIQLSEDVKMLDEAQQQQDKEWEEYLLNQRGYSGADDDWYADGDWSIISEHNDEW